MISFFLIVGPEQEHGNNGNQCVYNLSKRCFCDSSDLFVELDVAAEFFHVYSLCSVVPSWCFERFTTDCKVTILAEGPKGLAPQVMVKMERGT